MNLFEKYGGAEFWSELLNSFYTKLTESEVLRHHYRDKNIAQIKEMLLGVLEVTLVSYTHFSEEAMEKTHRNLGITTEEFDEWIKTFKHTLRKYGVGDIDSNYIVSTFFIYKKYIVTESD